MKDRRLSDPDQVGGVETYHPAATQTVDAVGSQPRSHGQVVIRMGVVSPGRIDHAQIKLAIAVAQEHPHLMDQHGLVFAAQGGEGAADLDFHLPLDLLDRIDCQGDLGGVEVRHGIPQPSRRALQQFLQGQGPPVSPAEPPVVGNRHTLGQGELIDDDLTVDLHEIIRRDHDPRRGLADPPLAANLSELKPFGFVP